MARSIVEILIDAVWKGGGAADKAEKAIHDVGDAAEKSGKKSNAFFTGVLQGVGQQALGIFTDAARDSVRALVDLGQESIQIAGDVGETTSLLQTSLGPAYEDFTRKVEAVGDATGRSSLKFSESVAPILAMQRSMGFAQAEAGDLAVSFGQAALDLESFFNTSTGFEDIQGALAGSSETMQKYGIDIRETQLQNRALELGLIDTRAEYDRQVRSLVILEEIQRQASDAMGDAAKTADSAVNQQRALTDEIYNLKAAIGDELLPVSEQLTSLKLEFLTEITPELIESVSTVATELNDILTVYRDLKSESAGTEGGLFNELFSWTQGESSGGLSALLYFLNPSQAIGKGIQKALGWDAETQAENAEAVRQHEALLDRLQDSTLGYAAELDGSATAAGGLTDELGGVTNAFLTYEEGLNQLFGAENKLTTVVQQGAIDRVLALRDEQDAIKETARLEEERAARAKQVTADYRTASTGGSLFENLTQAQLDLSEAQGEYLQVVRDNSGEIERINASLTADLTDDEKKRWTEVLRTADEGSADYVAAYDALQNDLSSGERTELVIKRSLLLDSDGTLADIYTGDAKEAEDAQKRIEAVNKAIAQSYDEAFTAVLVASGKVDLEEVLRFQVDTGQITQDQADFELALVNTTTAVQGVAQAFADGETSYSDALEATQLLKLGYAETTGEAIILADEIRGPLSETLLAATEKTDTLTAAIDRIEGDRTATITVQVLGFEQLQAAAEYMATLARGGYNAYDASGVDAGAVERQTGAVASTVTGSQSRGLSGQQ